MSEAERLRARVEAQEATIDRLLAQLEAKNKGIRNQQKKIEELRALVLQSRTMMHKLKVDVDQFRGTLEQIEELGHRGGYHGKGYSLATMAEEALKIWAQRVLGVEL